MQRTSAGSIAMFLIGALVLAGCSSSTGLELHDSADGLSVHLEFTPQSPKVGDVVTATLTIVNSTDTTITRTYPPHDFGPYVLSSSGARVLTRSFSDGFGDFVDIGQENRFDFMPNHPVAIIAHFDAVSAGTTELRGCLPSGDVAESPKLCVEASVVVGAH